MAKQVFSGVVAAAREVQQIQNRFQNDAGNILAGYESTRQDRKIKEQEAANQLKAANTYMDKLDSNIDFSEYSAEEQKLLKKYSFEKKNEYWELSGQLAGIANKGSAEAQEIVDQMNEIQNWYANVKSQNDKRAEGRANYLNDVNYYSKSGQNAVNIQNANAIYGGSEEGVMNSFTDIDPKTGEFMWGDLRLADGNKAFARPVEQINEILEMTVKAEESKDPYTPSKVAQKKAQVKQMLDKNVLAGLMAGQDFPWLEESLRPDFKEAFDKAYEEGDQAAIDALADELAGEVANHFYDLSTKNTAADPSDPANQPGPFANLSADSRATVKMFENGANFFSVGGGDRAYAYDEAGNISVLANGRPNPKYSGKPSVYVIGTYSDGQFTPNEARSGKIEAGNTAEFVRIVGLK